MNREIKFRGKNRLGGWVYGIPLLFDTNKDKEEVMLFSRYIAEDGMEHQTEWVVNRKTISQYTGLKDKNGKEIYEGDIVSVSVKSRNTVEVYAIAYDKERACFGLEKEYCGEKYISAFASWDEPNKDLFPYMSLVGNVYENTELIN